jgi:hypothetical protein
MASITLTLTPSEWETLVGLVEDDIALLESQRRNYTAGRMRELAAKLRGADERSGRGLDDVTLSEQRSAGARGRGQ